MKRVALFLLVAFAADAGGRFDRVNTRCAGGRSSRGLTCTDYAFFEFAPVGGAGMSAACACTTPTGAKGEALTFTRTGAATCSKQGLATTGIANGDLVVCSNNNEPRVEPSGGVLGLRVESARTNSILRSQEFNNAAWVLDGTGSTVPTVTANQATAPDGTLTADRVQVAACSSVGSNSVVYQLHATSGTGSTSSVYCRGNGSTQTIQVCSFGSTGGNGCTAVSCPSTSWSRGVDVRSTTTGTGGVVIGCVNLVSYTGSSNTGAADVFIWGAQSEMDATYATSYIPTVAASATRNAESPYLTVTAMTAGTYSTAANFETPYNITSSNSRLVTLYQTGIVFSDDYFPTNYTAFLYDGVISSFMSATAVTTSGRVGSYYDLTNLGVCVNATCTSTAAARTINNITRVRIGVDGSAGSIGQPNGIVTRVCADPNPTRCR